VRFSDHRRGRHKGHPPDQASDRYENDSIELVHDIPFRWSFWNFWWFYPFSLCWCEVSERGEVAW